MPQADLLPKVFCNGRDWKMVVSHISFVWSKDLRVRKT